MVKVIVYWNYLRMFNDNRKLQDDDDKCQGLQGFPSGHKKWIAKPLSIVNLVVSLVCERYLIYSFG